MNKPRKPQLHKHIVVCSTEDNSFYCNGELICTYSYDKKQKKYITKHIHKSYESGFKFLYANNIFELATQIQKRMNNHK